MRFRQAAVPPLRCIALVRPERPRSASSLGLGMRPSSSTIGASSAWMVSVVQRRRVDMRARVATLGADGNGPIVGFAPPVGFATLSRLEVARMVATGSVVSAATAARAGASCLGTVAGRTPPLVGLAVRGADGAFRDELL